MAKPTNELEHQIEAAFNFRGNVTIALTTGEKIEGYLSNREFAHPKIKEAPYVDVIRGGKAQRIALASIASVAITGVDCAKFTPPSAPDA
jgi:hypothetical protein